MSPLLIESSAEDVVDTTSESQPAARWIAAPKHVFTNRDPGLEALRRLYSLGANWDGYNAPPLRREILVMVERFLKVLDLGHDESPHAVVPLSSGGVQLEWHAPGRGLELEFESPTQVRYLKWQPALKIEEEDAFPIHDIKKAHELIDWFYG